MDKAAARTAAGKLAFRDDRVREERLRRRAKTRLFRETAESWETWYSVAFERELPGGGWARHYRAWGKRDAARIAPLIPEGGRVLELGCGDGRVLTHLAPRCGEIHAVDASGEALRLARQRCAALNNIRFHRARDWGLGFLPERRFDLAYSVYTLAHLDIEAVIGYIRELHRVLKPGASLLFNVPDVKHPIHLRYLLEPGRSSWPSPQRPRFWTGELVRRIVPELGFRIKKIDGKRFIGVHAIRR